ncbi:EamA family transporter [Variovorax sp. Varisp62]|uniref:EamA family transporter n=1 Tax=Variovorax sp. Varisp62 TaxID=3243049 RepID=UPI0039B40CA1
MQAALALVFNAFVWGISWFPFRQIASHGLHPLWATCLIYLVIAAAMGLLRRHAWKGFAAFPMLALLGLAAGSTNVGFNWAVTQGDVVRVVLLFYLMPLWSVLLGWLLLGTGFVFANVCLQYGAARLTAAATSVIMLSEVLFASVSSVALGAATMEPRILLGGALIVLGAVWSAFARTPGRSDDRASSPT